jgi:mono/diheme cytochrome c family protein
MARKNSVRDPTLPFLALLAVLSSAIALAACSQPNDPAPIVCTVAAPLACPEPAVLYADVAPIFEQRCASCHTGAAGAAWSLRDYEHVADWQDVVRAEVLHCMMPPADSGVTISDEERQTILAWVKCGARP